jgi:hypothetical protein
MKKTFFLSAVIIFGIALQALAVGNGQTQGNKSATGQGSQNAVIPGNQTGNTVQTQEQNKVVDQGENNQIQTQEQNTVQTQDNKGNKPNSGKSGFNPSEQRRSQVANAVQTMLQVADRSGGIGQQVRVIAQSQNQNQIKLEQNIEKIQSRSDLAKFFIGPNYGEIKNAQKTLEQNREQIKQLNQIQTQLTNQGDQQQLMEQIKILEQANLEIENSLIESQKGFSLFGWLNKLIS